MIVDMESRSQIGTNMEHRTIFEIKQRTHSNRAAKTVSRLLLRGNTVLYRHILMKCIS